MNTSAQSFLTTKRISKSNIALFCDSKYDDFLSSITDKQRDLLVKSVSGIKPSELTDDLRTLKDILSATPTTASEMLKQATKVDNSIEDTAQSSMNTSDTASLSLEEKILRILDGDSIVDHFNTPESYHVFGVANPEMAAKYNIRTAGKSENIIQDMVLALKEVSEMEGRDMLFRQMIKAHKKAVVLRSVLGYLMRTHFGTAKEILSLTRKEIPWMSKDARQREIMEVYVGN